MAFDFIAWHDRDTTNHKVETDKAAAAGYRTSSLSVYGDRAAPRYAAVMVKRAAIHAEAQHFGLSAAQFQQVFNEMSAKGFGPYLLSATGPANNPLIAASFRPMSPTPLTRTGVATAELAQLNVEAWRNGLIPASIDAYGTPGDVRFVAVWHPNTRRVAWNLEAVSDPTDLAIRQARFNAITAQGGRPTFTTITPDGEFLGLFVDDALGSWASRSFLTASEYQTEFNTNLGAGRAPIFVAGHGIGATTRFSAIFGDREEPVARVWEATGSPPVAGIETAMMKFIKDRAIRGCALAITRGARLVYARGYTWSEPNYPKTQPTTLFRLASVSKVFAAAAIWRLIQEGVKTPTGQTFSLDTTMQSILQLKGPKGEAPADPRFANIKIRHLLESTSSLNQGLIWWHVEAAEKHHSALPCTPAQLASFCTQLDLGKKDPGDTTNTVYGNADYFMLSQVVARLCNAASFEEALNQRVLAPLGIKRVRGSRSLLSSQALDEARYHTTNINPQPVPEKPGQFSDYPPSLWVEKSSRSDDRPLVPQAYGADNYEVFDGCGGLSGAATDIARLIAALSVRSNNPVFSSTTLDSWFQNAVTATSHFIKGEPDHGVHGFDSAGQVNPNVPIGDAGNFVAGKGGWLPSHACDIFLTAGEFGFVLLTNDGGQADVKTGWLYDVDGDGSYDPKGVHAVAWAHPWGTTDLFPTYGMSPLGVAPAAIVPTFDFSKLPASAKFTKGFVAGERATMERQRISATRLVR